MKRNGEWLRNRKIYILGVLLLLLIVVNLYERTKSSTSAVRRPDKRSGLQTPTQDPVLLADRLTAEKQEFDQEKRNIFTFFQAPPASAQSQIADVAPPPPPDPVCGNGVCEAGEDLMTCEGDCKPPPPPAPVISLRYIGYLNQAGGSVAFLTDGREVFMGRVNDVIANQYRVLKITEDSVELGFLNNNQSSTIRFQGNQGG